jgi:hypothetical protein
VLALALVFCFSLYIYFTQKDKRKLGFTVHVTERTEEAETLDFATHLYEDETQDKWQEKLNIAFKMAEDRRSYNNKRMMDLYAEAQKAKEENKVTAFKKV